MRYLNQILFLTLGVGAFLQAQTPQKMPIDTTLIKQLVIEKEFVPILEDATKINRFPSVETPSEQKIPIRFHASFIRKNLYAENSIMKSEPLKTGLPSRSQKAYIDAGLGNYWNALVNVGLNLIENSESKMSLSYQLNSTSSNRVLNQTEAVRNVYDWNNRFSLSYTRNFRSCNIGVDLKYMNKLYNYWSVDSLNSLNNPAINDRQMLNQFKLSAFVASEQSETFAWKTGIDYSFFNRWKTTFTLGDKGMFENRIKAYADLDFVIQRVDFNVATDLEGFLYTGNNELKAIALQHSSFADRLHWTLSPSATYSYGSFTFKAGLLAETTLGQYGGFFIAPDMAVDWRIHKLYQLSLTINGYVERNGFEESLDHTRFLSPSLRPVDHETPIEAMLFFHFKPISNLSASLGGGVKHVKDEHFLINESFNGFLNSRMQLSDHQDVTYGQLILKAAYVINSKIDLRLNFQQLLWSRESKVYQVAPTHLYTSFNYRITPKIYSSLTYHLLAGRKAFDPVLSRELAMNDAHLLSLKGAYEIIDQWSVNLSLNNLINHKYDLFYGVPSQGFNFMIGASYRFK